MWTHPIARPAVVAVIVKIAVVIGAGWLAFNPMRQNVDPARAAARLLSDARACLDAGQKPRRSALSTWSPCRACSSG